MAEIQNKLDYAQAIADWFLELGDNHLRRGDFEGMLKCNYVAGFILAGQNRDLVSVRIESNLRLLAGRLADQGVLQKNIPVKIGSPETCLHVLSEALPAGGHTAMASRWIQNDASGRVHSVALLSQQTPVPTSLQEAVEISGGKIHTAAPAATWVNRAAWLRRLAAEDFNYVILHVDTADVICGVAFGIPGGPPVILVNHAAHSYWSGASTIDLVANCRGSELEVFWSATYRGVGFSRCAIVPIPLLDPKSLKGGNAPKPELKRQSRQTLGVAPDAIVILTVGSAFKYLPIDGLDFLEVWERILRAVPAAVLLTVGFHGNQRWKDASARVGNRIRTLGPMPHRRLLDIQDVTDLYVEAFPFGTTTSLLEAGLKGIPVGLAPAQAPPPYGTDGIALDDILQRPATVAQYEATMRDLCRSADGRVALGSKVRDSILQHHSGEGWREHLETAIKSLPRKHTVLSEMTPVRTPAAIHEKWSLFVPQRYENTLEIAAARAVSLGLRPRLTAAVRQACRDHQALRSGRTIPVRALALLLNVVLPLLPDTWSSAALRAFVFLCRGSLLSRTWKKIAYLVGLHDGPPSPYQEYRQMREGPEPSSFVVSLRERSSVEKAEQSERLFVPSRSQHSVCKRIASFARNARRSLTSSLKLEQNSRRDKTRGSAWSGTRSTKDT